MGLIIVGASLQASAYSLAHLIVGRVITGFGTGIDSSTIPMYQSELAKKENRGRLVSWEIFFIGIGIVTGKFEVPESVREIFLIWLRSVLGRLWIFVHRRGRIMAYAHRSAIDLRHRRRLRGVGLARIPQMVCETPFSRHETQFNSPQAGKARP